METITKNAKIRYFHIFPDDYDELRFELGIGATIDDDLISELIGDEIFFFPTKYSDSIDMELLKRLLSVLDVKSSRELPGLEIRVELIELDGEIDIINIGHKVNEKWVHPKEELMLVHEIQDELVKLGFTPPNKWDEQIKKYDNGNETKVVVFPSHVHVKNWSTYYNAWMGDGITCDAQKYLEVLKTLE